ncbi:MAG: hypothetical protein JXB49_11265 [Bacteroidales bacterium]|nr:hypothetical protein [Bacteroidales bacterium]
MTSKNLLKIVKALLFALLIVLHPQCKKKEKGPLMEINPAFGSFISAFTSGTISNTSSLRIRLAEPYEGEANYDNPIDMELFGFSPSIKGSAYWIDDQTIEFRPDEKLKSNTVYTVNFFLSKIKSDVPKDLKTFTFQFKTIKQSFVVNIGGFKPLVNTDLTKNKIYGTINTSDKIDDVDIEKVLSAEQSGNKLTIKWSHEGDGKTHNFEIVEVVRADDPGKVEISWNGDAINVDVKGKETVDIPSLSDFSVMSVKIVQQPEQYIIIQFSDPIMKKQNLSGLISLSSGASLKYIIEDNEVRAYTSYRQTGNTTLHIQAGIKNILGYKLKESDARNITFEELKPEVRLIGNGVIIPNSDGLIFPFEAVNLKAVIVSIVRIYENNIPQFLQVNALDGNSQLKRVGRMVYKKTIQLTADHPIDYGQWNTFSLDLSELIKVAPGAIYRIEIDFTKKHSLYACESEEGEEEVETEEDMTSLDEFEYWEEDESSYWDYYEDYYDEYDYYYDDYYWEERDDPCSDSYYSNSRKAVSRNILASDLGIIAKAGNDNSMRFIVTDLKTTEPMPNVTLEVYNFQQQLIASTQTNSEGFGDLTVDSKPFLLIAKKDAQRGYLRLDDGSSLSLSNFDVGGSVVQKGVKGYIYGERGVWRPGDTLYLMFVLEDKKDLIPENHPVSFEFINPLGQTYTRKVKTTGENGFYNFTTITDPDVPTGNWTAKVKIGSRTFTKSIRIETIKPNRLKINLDFGVEKLTADNKYVEGEMLVKWLHGATAGNLSTSITVGYTPIPTQFPKYSDYTFDDPTRTFSTEEHTIFSGQLDSEGKATVKAELYTNNYSPGMLRASFNVTVYEEGGDFSVDRFSIPFSPYKTYVGIKTPRGDKRGMLLTDTTHTIDIVTLDSDGKPVSVTGLDVKIYKVSWRWWWDASYDNLGYYSNSSYYSPVFSETIDTRNGKGTCNFRINYPEWGRYLIRVYDSKSNHSTGKTIYCDWPGWAGRDKGKRPGEASMLVFTSDKQEYNVGDFASLSIPTPEAGLALVSIESGSRVVEEHWVEAQKGETVFNFKVTSEMAPNVYVQTTLIQPHAQTANDLPIRLYGVIPIKVLDPNTKLEPELKMPDVLTPQQKVKIQVSEKNGKEMTYTVAMVDEGLLDITRFPTPNPWESFYAREALGVKTWDMYDKVMGAYGGRIEQMFAIGGGWDEEGEEEGKKANRFEPMVRFLGPFTLPKGKSNTHTIELPNYIGSVRTFVVAGNKESAYGCTEKATPVKKALMVLATLPRVLGPGEEVKLPVTVFAMTEDIKDVSVEIKTNQLLEVQGSKTQNISFKKTGEQMVTFNLKVPAKLGVGKVTVLVKGGKETAEHSIEIDVRNPNPKVVESVDAMIEAGKSWNTKYTLPGIEGTNSAVLEISNIPPINFGRRLKYLLSYPHGCIEQTTSAAFPQLFLDDVMELNKAEKNKAESNVKAAIERLKTFILSNGAMGYWPNSSDPCDWGTSYAGHFLLEAEAKGYALPSGWKKKWVKYQKDVAKNWRAESGTYYEYTQNDLEQAYRLYTLALAGEQQMSAMNRLREKQGLTIQAKWRLAAAYVLAGQPEIAKEITSNIATDVEEYSGFYSSYGSRERDWAMILETMSLMNERTSAMPLVQKISDKLSSDYWMSTQTTAYCLLAMTKFAGEKGASKELKYTYTINNDKATKMTSEKPVNQVNIDVTNSTGGTVSVTNNGEGILFARVIMEGKPAVGDQKEEEKNLKMKIVYKDMNGNSIDVSRLEQGTEFRAEVTITNSAGMGTYKDMALNQIFPSGWEIRNTRLDDYKSPYQSDVPTYQDIRDDRVYTYFDINNNSSKTYVILLNAAYLGKFYMPTVFCEAMYDNRINARKPGKWVEVVKRGE